MFTLTYLQLAALLFFALHHFPEAIPKRWEAVSMYVQLCCQQQESESLISSAESGSTLVTVEVSSETESSNCKRTRRTFSGKANECKELAAILRSTSYVALCNSRVSISAFVNCTRHIITT